MVDYSFASKNKEPWILITHEPVSRESVPHQVLLLEMDALDMTDLQGLYREFSAAFKFPEYFGNNFNALDECLTDLDWLPADAYLLWIKNASCLLGKEANNVLEGLIALLHCAGEEWSKPVVQGEAWDREGVPFHTVLELDESEAAEFQEKLDDFSLQAL